MRAVYLLVIALVVLADPALAQHNLRYGFRAAANASSLDLDYSFDVDFRTERERGFGAAAFAETALTEAVAIAAEVSYARRGYSYPISIGIGLDPSGGVESIEERLTTSLDLGSLGATARFFPLGRAPLSPYVMAGQRVDVLLRSAPGRVTRPESEWLPVERPSYIEDSFPALFADVSLSGVVGLGVSVERRGWPGLRAEVHYTRTATDFLVNAPVEGSVSGLDLSLGVVW